jgi:hypothetical protein
MPNLQCPNGMDHVYNYIIIKADINYEIEQTGSLDDYRYLLAQKKYKIVLYNGDWDAVVPYTDTLKGLASLNLIG